MKLRSKKFEFQRGVAAIEFLIVAPLLMLVVLAVSELGWAFHQYHTMTRAARDGARHLAAHAMTGVGLVYLSDSLIQQASNLVVYGNVVGAGEPLLPGWTTSDVTVSSPDPEHVKVSVHYGYVPLLGVIPAFYGSQPVNLTFDMQSTVQMRAL